MCCNVQFLAKLKQTRMPRHFCTGGYRSSITFLILCTCRLLQGRMEEAKQLFRNADTTEFVIVTIPTVMAASESARLAKSLRVENIPLRSIVINQVCVLQWLPPRRIACNLPW